MTPRQTVPAATEPLSLEAPLPPAEAVPPNDPYILLLELSLPRRPAARVGTQVYTGELTDFGILLASTTLPENRNDPALVFSPQPRQRKPIDKTYEVDDEKVEDDDDNNNKPKRMRSDGWGANMMKFAPGHNNWKCGKCGVLHLNLTLQECNACDTKRSGGGTGGGDESAPAPPTAGSIGAGGFTFATATSTETTDKASSSGVGGFTFATADATESNDKASSSGGGGFTFPTAAATESIDKAPASGVGGFTFAKAATTETTDDKASSSGVGANDNAFSSKGGFKFGAATETKGGFRFG